MTTSETPLVSTLTTRRGVKALRRATRVLRAVAARSDVAALGALVASVIAEFTHTGPAWLQARGNAVLVFALAAVGAATILSAVAGRIADRIDPDVRDGDEAFVAASVLKDLAYDVRQGADREDVLIALQASRVLPALRTVLGALGDAYDEYGEEDEAAELYAAGSSVRDAARRLGDRTV